MCFTPAYFSYNYFLYILCSMEDIVAWWKKFINLEWRTNSRRSWCMRTMSAFALGELGQCWLTFSPLFSMIIYYRNCTWHTVHCISKNFCSTPVDHHCISPIESLILAHCIVNFQVHKSHDTSPSNSFLIAMHSNRYIHINPRTIEDILAQFYR